ncbi:MAG: transketolase C-terminal domain-containing protein, partial [Steroidobacteraceae bacterium]
VRYPRGSGPGTAIVAEMSALPIGRAELRRRGDGGLALLAFGAMVMPATALAERLDATLVNMRFIKPLDTAMLREIALSHAGLVTLEDNVIAGGAGSACSEALDAEGIATPRLHLGIPDRIVEHGSRDDCLAAAGLDLASLSAAIERWRSDTPALKPARSATRLTAAGGVGPS